jgi:hypothetical protein
MYLQNDESINGLSFLLRAEVQQWVQRLATSWTTEGIESRLSPELSALHLVHTGSEASSNGYRGPLPQR